MKKVLLTVCFVLLLLPLAADSTTSNFTPATVVLSGVIQPKDLSISIFNEVGEEVTAESAFLNFEFPALEEWEVSRSLSFTYSSQLSKQTSGTLSFEIGSLALDDQNSIKPSVELVSDDRNTHIENGTSFATTFLAGYQEDVPIGTLTVRIEKRAADVFTAGAYTGNFSIKYTEGT